MTREKLINEITKDVATEFRFSDLTEIIDSGAVEFVIDEMLLKFESRTCESCKYAKMIKHYPMGMDTPAVLTCTETNKVKTAKGFCDEWKPKDE